MSMLWLNFLHIYQPPTLDKEILVRITREAYFNIVDILKKHPRHKITLNIAACLTEYLNQIGFTRLIDDIKLLALRGQIELTGSAAFHPLLPLVPLKEVKRQLEINNQINRRYLGRVYQPHGFYLPEMAYAPGVGRLVKRAGFEWIILDEIALAGKLNAGHLDYEKKYRIKGNQLGVVFRERKLSKTFVPQSIKNLLDNPDRPNVVISATDGELYGHKYVDSKNIFNQVLSDRRLRTATLSEFLRSRRPEQKVDVLNCSWESTPAELAQKIPYSLWNHPDNLIHKKLWQLADFALKLNYKNHRDPNYFAARLHLEKGLASCTFWWASGKDFKLFNDPAWSPEEVEKGALELLRSVRALKKIRAATKIRAEGIFIEIHRLIWRKHWIQENRNNE